MAAMVKIMSKILKVKCPQCATIFSYYESEFRPFCCERCKLIDLGHWFEETYRVPEKEKKPYEQDQENYQDQGFGEETGYEQSYDEKDESDYE